MYIENHLSTFFLVLVNVFSYSICKCGPRSDGSILSELQAKYVKEVVIKFLEEGALAEDGALILFQYHIP